MRSSRDELAEIITDAWLTKAPKSLAKAFLRRRWLSPGLGVSSGAAHLLTRPAHARSCSTRRAPPHSTCSRRSGSTAPTPTWCCPAVIRHYELEGRDAAFATELASGTIRRRGTYDAILAACIDRPLSKVESKVLDALRLGTHQLLSMRVPTTPRSAPPSTWCAPG